MMTPVLLLVSGFVLIALTLRSIRDEESDLLSWTSCLWWNVNKTENPLLYRIAIVVEFSVSLFMIATGVIWLVYFR
jgi:hypothetical protein